MGKRSKPESGKRRAPGLDRRVFWSATMSALLLAVTTTLALSGVGAPTTVVPAAAPPPTTRPAIIVTAPSVVVTDVTDPYAKDQITPSESPAATTPPVSPTLAPTGASRPLSAPATGSPVRRISAIHIERPAAAVTTVGPETTTVTETVAVPAPEAEEEVAGEAKRHRQVDRGAECVAPRGNYDGVEPYVGIIGAHIQKKFGVTEVAGKAGRPNASEHPIGLALDFMTNTGNVDGDAIKNYLVENAEQFGIKYVIWQQRITFPGGKSQEMEDRGSDTANHRDHVHVSFNDTPGPVTPTC